MNKTIMDGCLMLGIPYPVSSANLHDTYATFLVEGFEPNTMDTPHWRGTCNCLEAYGSDDPKHIAARAKIMEHLEMLSQ